MTSPIFGRRCFPSPCWPPSSWPAASPPPPPRLRRPRRTNHCRDPEDRGRHRRRRQLDEAVWRRAAVLTGFSLYSPVDKRPASDSTEILVWYSSSAIHFGIRAFEAHGHVTATLADRDRIAADDNIEIHLDTFDERNRAFVFLVNPLGVQADGIKNETGGFVPGSNVMPGMNDLSADFVWQSRGRLMEAGYVIEVRIPFGSLRYPLLAEQRWGLQIDRHVQHNGYEETWTPALKASASFIGQAGYITGLTGLHHGQLVELNPEVTNTVTGSPCCAQPQAGWRYDANPQIGGNIRWTLGSNYVLNGTVKPDFSQVEADATQIAADARFALFYAEKRPFFVEGARSIQRAEQPRLHANDRASRRRGEVHREARASRHRRALGARPVTVVIHDARPATRRHRAPATELRRAVARGSGVQRARRRRA
jgi:hypothetical protein